MTNYYAGIGSRDITDNIAADMMLIGQLAAKLNWILRSGAANGADTSFEMGCDLSKGTKEIFLPWRAFNNHSSLLYTQSDDAVKTASCMHPAYRQLTPAAKLLVSRNMHQIMGIDMETPVRCVVAWTKDGCEDYTTYSGLTGGTGTAISLASRQHIPIFNLYNKGRIYDVVEFLFDPDEAEVFKL